MTLQNFIRELEQEAGQEGSQKEVEFRQSWKQDEDLKIDTIESKHPNKLIIWLVEK